MRDLNKEELMTIAGGWPDCPFCEDEAKPVANPDEFDDDPRVPTDYAPKPMPGILQNYFRWWTQE
jgi:hypothetical protein